MCEGRFWSKVIIYLWMTMCLELISAHGQVYVTLERVMVMVAPFRRKANDPCVWHLRAGCR